jgi:lipopolysaccharide biosynthesis regulator YciM
MSETTMSEYLKGFNDGYAYVLEQIERHPDMTVTELLHYLKGDVEQKSQASCGGIVVA